MKTLFFSDVHLDVAPEARPYLDGFVRFLRRIDPHEVNRIIIVGDLFDFWFEYRHTVFSGYFPVLRAFAALRDAGVECHFICGNHDFWAGRFLRDDLGFHIHPDQLTLDLDGLRALVVHGDGRNPRDVGYRFYKRLARARVIVWAFSLLHPDWAMGLAQRVSRTSRRLTQAEDLSKGPEVEPLRQFARAAVEAGQADIVVCGHSHHPANEEFSVDGRTGRYINTGDWLWHKSYVTWEDGVFETHSFDDAAAPEPEPRPGA